MWENKLKMTQNFTLPTLDTGSTFHLFSLTNFFIRENKWKVDPVSKVRRVKFWVTFHLFSPGSDGYRYPSTDTVSVKTTKIVSVSALEIFCIRIRIRPEIFLYPYPFLNFFGFVSVSVINSKFLYTIECYITPWNFYQN